METDTQKQAPPRNEGVLEKMRRWGRSIFNNIDQINFYARMKDVYKILDVVSIGSSAIMISGAKRKTEESKKIHQIDEKLDSGNFGYGTPQRAALKKERAELSKSLEQKQSRISFRWGLAADTLNTFFQLVISLLSNWDDKDRTVRIYRDLVKEELGLDRPVKFEDLKHSSNPIVRDAHAYYKKKSFIRMLPDFAGLIRWVPQLAHMMGGPESGIYRNTKWMEVIPGTTLGLGAKTGFFGWYFTERQTGSNYELINLWNNTEGASFMPNRALNQNKLPGDFVRWQEIRTVYERFREEHPEMKLTEFTPDDPLTARVFEQVARYMNHTYMPKIFSQLEHNRQDGVQGHKITHAMLVDLVGTGGLRVEDAIGSAIRVEILAHYGTQSISGGMKKYREADAMLKKIPRPKLTDHPTPEEGAEALHRYFTQVESVAEQFLGDSWPTGYYENEIKPGYINYFFRDNPPPGMMEYLLPIYHHEKDSQFAKRSAAEEVAATSGQQAFTPEELTKWVDRRVQEGPARKPEKAASFTELANLTASEPQVAGV